MVVDFCAGKCFTAEARVLPDQHRMFVGCHVDYELLTAAEADLVLSLVSHLLHSESDVSGDAEEIAAKKVFKNIRVAVRVSKMASV